MRLPFGLNHAKAERSPDERPPVPPAPEVLAETLSDRYSIEREVARGGMATIYLAHDLRDGRLAAIKVMHPGPAAELGAERFHREIEIAASMAHPLIVPLYESGSAGSLLYYIMPYVEGETLYDRVKREKRIPLEDALRITCDVAAALGYAHSRGVLHRDVKPENILLAGGRAMVADFGLARAIGAAGYQKLTSTGIIVGTVFYMSPEQVREDRDLDQRADVYSLGCVLYEMLAGEPPYTGASLQKLVAGIIRGPIPSVRRLNAGVPAVVDETITRALAKLPAGRFGTMEEFSAALPRV